MTNYEIVGRIVVWTIAILLTPLPIFAVYWALNKILVEAFGILILAGVAVRLYPRSSTVWECGLKFWKWKSVYRYTVSEDYRKRAARWIETGEEGEPREDGGNA